ncbi:MAG: AAA family ATPase [Bacteroidetes bacterium]|nr:AAA family ATPase [Bacteroidota bacterium]
MQLVKLYIEQYKNLNQLDIDFSDNENVSVIIGNNGSGKSNIVEAISGIFGGLYLQDPHKIFRKANKPKGTQSPFDYKIEYTIGTKNIKAEYTNATSFSFKVDDIDMIPSDFFKRSEELLPSQVIANYSGEEGRLFDIFYWPFYSSFTAEFLSIGKLPSITQKLFFVNKYYWDLALLTMLYRQELNNRQGQVNKELDSFLKDVLNIQTVDNIHFSFNPVKYKKYPQTETIQLVTKLNPQKKKSNTLTLAELTDILDNNTDKYFFNLLTTAYMPAKEKILPEIRIDFNGTIDSTCFSEGEKKLILLQFILEILADDESLILLDEPDSHIHISRKELIKDLIDKYSKRKNVLTTHSPTLTHNFDIKHIISVVKEAGQVSIEKNDKIELIEKLTNGTWSYQEQSLFLNAKNDILLVEGWHDKTHIKEALKHLSSDFPTLKFDIFDMNGATNIKQLLIGLSNSGYIKNKKVIGLYDEDKEGREAVKANFDKTNAPILQLKSNNDAPPSKEFFGLLYPVPKNWKGDFTVENFYDGSKYEEAYIEALDKTKGYFKAKPIEDVATDIKLKSKNILAYNTSKFVKSDFDGFKPLFDILLQIKAIN